MEKFVIDNQTLDHLLDKVANSEVTKLKLKQGDFELVIESQKETVYTMSSQVMSAPAGEPAGPAASGQAAPAVDEPAGNVVKSPIIGTYYAAPGPDKDPFVTVGKTVKKGDVLFIVESMKLMNEIKSEFDGKVSKILVNNEDSVDYNQPVLVIE